MCGRQSSVGWNELPRPDAFDVWKQQRMITTSFPIVPARVLLRSIRLHPEAKETEEKVTSKNSVQHYFVAARRGRNVAPGGRIRRMGNFDIAALLGYQISYVV